jgi:sodium-dependent dicarboxylate transporter 2/3/5
MVVVAATACLIILLTELTSNTATTAAFLPVPGAVALQADLQPLTLALPTALAASCAFMLPVAAPPNAIVFSSGHVTIPAMIRVGFSLNVLGIVVITVMTQSILPYLFP